LPISHALGTQKAESAKPTVRWFLDRLRSPDRQHILKWGEAARNSSRVVYATARWRWM